MGVRFVEHQRRRQADDVGLDRVDQITGLLRGRRGLRRDRLAEDVAGFEDERTLVTQELFALNSEAIRYRTQTMASSALTFCGVTYIG